MRKHDHVYFKRFTRMSPQRFDHLLSLVQRHMKRWSSRALSPGHRLAITLRYNHLHIYYNYMFLKMDMVIMLLNKQVCSPCYRFLATGDSYPSLAFGFRVGISTIHYIIKDTCTILWKVLQPDFLKVYIFVCLLMT